MRKPFGAMLLAFALIVSTGVAHADKYTDTIALFKQAGQSAAFFHKCYGYAVFPTIGEAALTVGAALGKGRVYVHGRYVGDTTMTQVSVGLQAGGKAYSEIIFFENKRAIDAFKSGKFEFSAGASAIAITAGASASAGSNGVSASASATAKDATTTGSYGNGIAVFTIAKGGLMYQAAIAGQKFSYKARGEP